MPDWIVTTVNTSALAGGCLFGMWATVAIARFLGPRLSRFFEAHVALIDSLRTNLQALTSLSERGVDMLDEHGERLDDLEQQGRTLDDIHKVVQEIHQSVHQGRHREREHWPPSTAPKNPPDLRHP